MPQSEKLFFFEKQSRQEFFKRLAYVNFELSRRLCGFLGFRQGIFPPRAEIFMAKAVKEISAL